jgi:hypothetical protein
MYNRNLTDYPKFEVGQTVIARNNQPLPGNSEAPPLVVPNEYQIKNIIHDSKGNPHLDVGLPSSLAFVRSYETKENLPDGDKIHWCHPSRFDLKAE